MMVYQWTRRSHPPLDPQIAGERIAWLRSQGRSEVGDIVEDAEPEDSALHRAFTWDDGDAAHAHRLWEARNLVNTIRIVREDLPDRPTAPAFVSVIVRETGRRAYVPLLETITDEDYQDQRLNDARDYFIAGRRRFRDLSDPWLRRIFKAIDAGEAKSKAA